MARDQRHVGTRLGGVPEKQGRHQRRPELRAYGSIAYATVYSELDERREQRDERKLIDKLQGRAKQPPAWLVEIKHDSGLWVTAEKAMQGSTLQGAVNLARMSDRYRVVVRDSFGRYSPLRKG